MFQLSLPFPSPCPLTSFSSGLSPGLVTFMMVFIWNISLLEKPQTTHQPHSTRNSPFPRLPLPSLRNPSKKTLPYPTQPPPMTTTRLNQPTPQHQLTQSQPQRPSQLLPSLKAFSAQLDSKTHPHHHHHLLLLLPYLHHPEKGNPNSRLPNLPLTFPLLLLHLPLLPPPPPPPLPLRALERSASRRTKMGQTNFPRTLASPRCLRPVGSLWPTSGSVGMMTITSRRHRPSSRMRWRKRRGVGRRRIGRGREKMRDRSDFFFLSFFCCVDTSLRIIESKHHVQEFGSRTRLSRISQEIDLLPSELIHRDRRCRLSSFF